MRDSDVNGYLAHQRHDGYDESRSLRGLYDACVAKGYGSRQLAKKEQKALDKLLAKRKKVIAKRNACDAALAELDLQVEEITGAKPAESTFASFD